MSALHALYAQTTAPAQQGGSLVPFLFQLGAIMAIFYFLMIRPQQKQRKRLEGEILALKKGDGVVTTGGVVGEVVHIKEQVDDGRSKGMDDLVTIRTGDTKIVIQRRAVAQVFTPGGSSAA
jgi:preprotein translocase subunit YajC